MEELDKSLGGILGAVGLAISGQSAPPAKPASAPKAETSAKTPSKKELAVNLHQDLHPMAHLESSWGQNVVHAPHSKGEFHTAHGLLGFKPSTAHEEYTKSPKLKAKYPNLSEPADFTSKFKTDQAFYNDVASAHFNRLKARHGSKENAAFAWRWGSGAAQKATPETISSDEYVTRYKKLMENTALNKSEADLMPGGKGDNKPDDIFEEKQLKRGVEIEMKEHGLDEARAKEIAKDHLTEDPNYYLGKSESAPGLHSTVEGFMSGLKALPKEGPHRGKFITQHMSHAPFLSALKEHPQGQQVHAMLTNHLNSRANAGMGSGSKVTVK